MRRGFKKSPSSFLRSCRQPVPWTTSTQFGGARLPPGGQTRTVLWRESPGSCGSYHVPLLRWSHDGRAGEGEGREGDEKAREEGKEGPYSELLQGPTSRCMVKALDGSSHTPCFPASASVVAL